MLYFLTNPIKGIRVGVESVTRATLQRFKSEEIPPLRDIRVPS